MKGGLAKLGSPDVRRGPPRPWACGVCTFENDGDSPRCGMCSSGWRLGARSTSTATENVPEGARCGTDRACPPLTKARLVGMKVCLRAGTDAAAADVDRDARHREFESRVGRFRRQGKPLVGCTRGAAPRAEDGVASYLATDEEASEQAPEGDSAEDAIECDVIDVIDLAGAAQLVTARVLPLSLEAAVKQADRRALKRHRTGLESRATHFQGVNSMALHLFCVAIKCVGKPIHLSRTRREMIPGPKMSRNETRWKLPGEI